MRAIHIFHRRVNYTSVSADRMKCEKSLRHSLRLITESSSDSTKKFEWNKKLSHNNIIWYEGGISPLDNYTTQERWEVLYDIAPEPEIRDKTKLLNQQRQYRLKIKKAICSEEKAGHTEAVKLLKKVIDTKRFVGSEVLDELKRAPLNRPQQRLNMVYKYLNAHNRLIYRVPSNNNVYVQEGIFKIPHQWQVTSTVIDLRIYIEFTHQFLTEHFPEFEVKAIFGHDDERLEEQQTGLHTHYFISGRKNLTNEYTLHKKQIEVVNKYLSDNGRTEEQLPVDGKMTHQQSRLFGRYFQEMFLDYTNKQLLNQHGLMAEFTDETERKSYQYRKMNEQAKLPKGDREFNFYNMQIEALNHKVAELQTDESRILERRDVLIPLLQQAESDLKSADSVLKDQNGELQKLVRKQSELKDDIEALGYRYISMEHSMETKISELAKVEEELAQAESNLAEVNMQTLTLMEKVIENAFIVILAKAKNNRSVAVKFLEKLAESVKFPIPSALRSVIDRTTLLANDDDFIDELIGSTNEKNEPTMPKD
ncbi:hypothetical protein CSW98_09690 [Vibrio sp. HA2012]|nr:hypothetical protein CSW98_09690 [Vibrio sp. HA2012]